MDTCDVKNITFSKNKKYSIDELNEENFWNKKEPENVAIKLNLSKNIIYFQRIHMSTNRYTIQRCNYIRRIIVLRKIYKNILDKHNILYIPEIQNIIFTYVGWNNIYLDKQIKHYKRNLGSVFIQRYIEPDYNSSHE